MSYPLVLCPMTRHIERLEVDDHPLGAIVTGCTQFRPACSVMCGASCAAVLDGRAAAACMVELDDTPTTVDVCGPIASAPQP